MSVATRMDYFIGILMYKTINGIGIDYLLPEITYVNEYHNYNTRAASNNLIVQNIPHCELYRTSLYYTKEYSFGTVYPIQSKTLIICHNLNANSKTIYVCHHSVLCL